MGTAAVLELLLDHRGLRGRSLEGRRYLTVGEAGEDERAEGARGDSERGQEGGEASTRGTLRTHAPYGSAPGALLATATVTSLGPGGVDHLEIELVTGVAAGDHCAEVGRRVDRPSSAAMITSPTARSAFSAGPPG